jgi:hypothetical protein
VVRNLRSFGEEGERERYTGKAYYGNYLHSRLSQKFSVLNAERGAGTNNSGLCGAKLSDG